VAKDVVKILGDWNAWAEPVRQGRLVRPDGESSWVLIRCRADVVLDADSWRAIKLHGRLISRIDHPGVLHLFHTSKVDGQPAWVYEGFQAVSLARALDVANANKEFLPARAAVEAVERASQGIRAALTQGQNIQGSPGPVIHLGPAPSELLVDSTGSLRVAGFSIEVEGAPGLRAPSGYAPFKPGTPAQRAVYGLGALLVHLLGGERPGTAGDDARRQSAVIRRAVIRVLSRPGEAVPDTMTDLIRSVLAFEPEDRPTLSELQDVLVSAAEQFGSAGLRTWAPERVPGLLKQAELGYPDPDTVRMRRHIESSEEAGSGAFTRKKAQPRVPREVATIVGRPAISPQAPLFSTDPHAEATPLVSSGSLSVNPTSETDIATAFSEVAKVEAESTDPVPFEIDGPDDTWERTGVDDSSRLGGWPLILGAMIGMVVAAVVGWFAVEHMLAAPLSTDVVDFSGSPQALPKPAVVPVVPVAPVPAEVEVAVEAEPAVGAPKAETEVSPDIPSTPVEAKVPAEPSSGKTTPSDTTAGSAGTSATPATDGGSDSEEFVVSFRSFDATIDRMTVICHKGGVGEGVELVQLIQAGRGPCTVHGFRGTEKVSVFTTLTGPDDYACFKGGARACE
jgi:hypothetical protein